MIYLMMFPRNFKFAYPQIITSFEEFELYVQMYEFGYRSLRIDVLMDKSSEWEKIIEKYEDWIFTHYLVGEGKINFRFGYDPTNSYSDEFFSKNVVETLRIIKMNLKIGFHKTRACYWQFAQKTEWSGYFAIYREIAHFAFELLEEGTYSFIDFLNSRGKYWTEQSDFYEIKNMYNENEDFRKEIEEEIIVKKEKEGW